MLRRLLLLLPAFVVLGAVSAAAQSMPTVLPMGGTSGGGLSSSGAAGVFLKLDGSNDPMTGALSGIDGTAAAPAFSFTTASDAGLFFTAGSDTVTFRNNSGNVDVTSSLDVTITAGGDDLLLGALDTATLAGVGVNLISTGGVVVEGGVGVISLDSDVTIGSSGDDVTVNANLFTFAIDTSFALSGGTNGLNIDSNTLSVDATNNRIGIGTAAPGVALDVVGGITLSGALVAGDAAADTVTSNAGVWSFPSDTTVALGGGVDGINFDSNTLSIDATNNRIGVGTAAPGYALDVENGDVFIGRSSAANYVRATIQNYSSSGAADYLLTAQSNGAFVMRLHGTTFSSAGSAIANSGLLYTDTNTLNGINISAAANSAPIIMYTAAAGAEVERMRLNSSGVIVNETSADGLDFRVEGNTLANLLFVQGSTDRVGVNDSTPDAVLDVGGTFTADGAATFGSTVAISGAFNYISNATPQWYMQDNNASANEQWWYQQTSGSSFIYGVNNDAFGTFNTYLNVTRSGATVTSLSFSTGTPTEKLGIGTAAVVVNEASGDVDLRWESDTNANGLFGDASTSRVGVNNAAPAVDLDVTGTIAASTQIQAPAGSGASPGIRIGTDSDTGLYNNLAGGHEIDAVYDSRIVAVLGSVGLPQTIFGANDSTDATLQESWIQLPRAVGASVGGIGVPTCNSSNAGLHSYIDDTNDSKPGVLCYCVGDNTDTFAWQGIAFVGGVPTAATCPP